MIKDIIIKKYHLYYLIINHHFKIINYNNEHMSIQKKKPMSESTVLMNGMNKLQNKQNLNCEQIRQMIDLLKAYETLCIKREDFNGAEGVKNKIEQLKEQELSFRKEVIAVKEKQQIEVVCKEGQEEIKRFQDVWDSEIQKLIEELKVYQQDLCNIQKTEMEEFVVNLQKEEISKVKYSSFILQKRKYLSNLIKTRNYKQAEVVKHQLKDMETEQEKRWIQKMAEKNKLKIDKLEKKQISELHALRVKLQALFNEKIKQRDRKFQILLKKNRKRRIESSKPSRERIRSRNGVLTESKLNVNLQNINVL